MCWATKRRPDKGLLVWKPIWPGSSPPRGLVDGHRFSMDTLSDMILLYTSLAVMLLATMVLGFLRILKGPLAVDCIVAVLFFGTTGVGVLLLLSVGLEDPRLIDVALVFALLSAVMGATYVKLGWRAELDMGELADD